MAHPGPGDQKTLDCPVNTMSDWGWHTTPVAKSLTPTANVSASSNGQLMYAVAMLAGGWDGGSFTWPSGWSVKAEGFPRLLSDDEDTGSTKTTTRRPDKVAMGGGRENKVNWWLRDRTDPQDSDFVAQHSQAATGIIPCFETWQIHDDGTSSPDMSTFTGKW